MSNQLKKKFLGSDSVDGTKIKFGNDDAFRARNQLDTADISLFKLNASNQFELIILPQYNGSNVATESYVDTEIDVVADDVSHLVVLSGVVVDSNNLGSFTGATISDSQTIKGALQDLESAHEEVDQNVNDLISLSGVAENSANLGSFSGTTIADAQTIKQALQSLETAVESVSGGGSSTQLELDDTQIGAGLEIDGSYAAPIGSNYLGLALSLKHADSLLDSQVKVVADDLAQEILDRASGDQAVQDNLDAHITDATDAHDASAISITAITNIDATDVQGALAEIQGQLDTVAGDFVDVAGDTMTGSLIIDSGVGNSNTLSENSILIANADNSTSISIDDLVLSSTDNVTYSSQANVYSGNVVLTQSDLVGATTFDSTVSLTANLTDQLTIQVSNHIDQNVGTTVLSQSALDFDFQDNATGVNSTASFQHNVVSMLVSDTGAGTSGSFEVIPGVSVSLISNNGSGPSAVTPVQDFHLVPKKYVDDGFIRVNGTNNMMADLDMMDGATHYKIVGLGDPTAPRDAANKQYVDAVAEGLHVHAPAKAILNSPLSGSVTYDNGVDGVGATLTLGTALVSIDSYTLQDQDRIIINGQANQAHNGIYVFATGGTELTRASDFNTTTEAAGGDFMFVQEGTTYGNSGWVMTETTSTIGSSPIIFVQFSGAGQLLEGDAIDLQGNEINVIVDNTGIEVNVSNQLQLKDSGVVNAKIANLAVDSAKISSDVAGVALEKSLLNGKLDVKTDGISISINGSNQVHIPMNGVDTNEIKNSAVSTDKIADDAVTAAKVNSDVAGIAMEKSLLNDKLDVKTDGVRISVNGSNQLYIPMDGVDTNEIKNSAVTTDKILDDAVTAAKINSDVGGIALEKSLLNDKLDVKTDGIRISVNGSNQLYIPMDGVDTNEIKNSAVTTGKILDDAVTAAKINSDVGGIALEKSLLNDKLDVKTDGVRISVNGSNQLYIPMDGVDSNEIKASAVSTAKIANDAVDKDKINSDVAGVGLQQDLDGSLAVKLDGTSLSKSASGVKLNIESHKEAYTVQAGDDVLSSNFYDLDFVAEPNTIIGFVDRVAIHQSLDSGASDDFTVAATGGVGGVTRITFVNALATPGQQKLAAGDRLYFTYQKKIS